MGTEWFHAPAVSSPLWLTLDGHPTIYRAREVTLTAARPAQVLRLRVLVDGVPLWEERGDGVVISLPIPGGYAQRVSGIWTDPQARALIVAPICCHSLSVRPVVLSTARSVQVIQLDHGRAKAQVLLDGERRLPLPPGGRLTVAVDKSAARPGDRYALSRPVGWEEGERRFVPHSHKKTAP